MLSLAPFGSGRGSRTVAQRDQLEANKRLGGLLTFYTIGGNLQHLSTAVLILRASDAAPTTSTAARAHARCVTVAYPRP